ncbi:Pre-rRNA-processing protein fhl1, partial [Ceratobasidium sp. 392]
MTDILASAPAPNDETITTNKDAENEQTANESGEETRNGGENASGNEAQSEEIAAYFKLESALFTYYCQTLVVTIGRRPPAPARSGEGSVNGNGGAGGGAEGDGSLVPPHEILTLAGPSNAPSSEPAGTSAGVSGTVVDVDLGQLKSVSRLHARIEYDESDSCFVLAVLGRNGAWVDGDWYGSGRRAPLTARSRIQIATRVFYFVLPDTAPPRSPSTSSQCSNHSHSRSRTRSRSRSRTVSLARPGTPRQRSPSVDIMSSAESGDDTKWIEPEPEPPRGRTTRKAPAGKAIIVGKGKGKDKETEAEAAPAKGKGGKGKGKGKATPVSRDAKRKQPDSEPSTSKLQASKSTAVASKGTATVLEAGSALPTPNSESEPAP